MDTEYFKITRPDGTVSYEARGDIAPSARLLALRAEFGPEVVLGIVRELPASVRDIIGVAVKVGDYVRLRAYGTGYVGKVVKVGRLWATVRITLADGREKTIERRLSELTVTRI